MLLLFVVLSLLAVAGIAGAIRAAITDGYGPRPARGDRFTDPRRHI